MGLCMQYAIQTGTHPAITTERNINRFREQLQSLGKHFQSLIASMSLPCQPNMASLMRVHRFASFVLTCLTGGISWYSYQTVP